MHLLEAKDQEPQRRFTGVGIASELLCRRCTEPGATPELLESCAACFARVERENEPTSFSGQPGILERPSSLRLERTSIDLSVLGAEPIALAAPSKAARWLVLTRDSKLHVLDAEGVDLVQPVWLGASPRGDLAAIANRRGQRGVCVDAATGRATLALDRGEYHPEVCDFSAVFLERGGRTLLVHATLWNRLDVSDARTGERLTARTFEARRTGEPREHDLDYFHCGLAVSPDEQWISDNGWMWHPVGFVRTFSVERWLGGNVYESEDGPSVKQLLPRDGYWDGPLVWVGPRRLALYGYGVAWTDGDRLIPAALVFDVESGELERWFAGPSGELFFVNGLLVSASSDETCAWDLATGERLLRAMGFRPTHHLPATGQLGALGRSELRIGRLEGVV